MVHKKCSGIKGSMSKVAKSFICRGCLNPVTSAGRTIGDSAKLELVDKFCYLGDMLSVDGDANAAVEARIRIGWNKFRQLVPLLTNKDVSGRPKRTWTEVVEKDCQACKLNKEDAMDCSKWGKLIKDV